MPITPKNLVRHELIGLPVKIVKSTDPTKTGISGKVVDETQKTLVIRKQDGKEIRVAKKECVFHFMLKDGTVVEVDGKLIYGRGVDRIKKKLPKRL